MKLFLDDVRDAPEGWRLVRTVDECIRLLLENVIEEISLDHDLGSDNTGPTGMSVIEWIEDEQSRGWTIPRVISVHSMNPVGRERMLKAIERINWRRGL
jgi:hypothetical protein